MNKKIFLTACMALSFLIGRGQTGALIAAKYIHNPVDSVQSQQLIAALDSFLSHAAMPAKENRWILKQDLPETAALLRQISGMENGDGFGF